MRNKKKLIEVAIPLDAINKASAREKSIRHGHPSTLHLWWARRPLAAARAVIFAQMVDDPSAHPDLFPTEKAQEKERQRLFRIIEDLVLWENTTNEKVLQQARDEIWQSWRYTCAENAGHPRAAELFDRYKLPAFHDPFAGGGALPLEAQRLGLEAYASDLNPVAVLINKAMIEIPPKFAGKPPVHPWEGSRIVEVQGRKLKVFKGISNDLPSDLGNRWEGAAGLAEDVRYYGKWMRDEAEKRIGHLYPKIEITAEMALDRPDLETYVGRKLTIIAWLWARTVKSPNPAFSHVDVPLVSTFMLSTKPGKEAYVEPVISPFPAPPILDEEQTPSPSGGGPGMAQFSQTAPVIGEEQIPSPSGGGPGWGNFRFKVKVGKPENVEETKAGTKLSRGANFKCVMSGAPIAGDYIKAEGKAGRMGARLMAIVADGDRGRVYLAPTPEQETVAQEAKPVWKPEQELLGKSGDQLPLYGMRQYWEVFTPRQLVALTTFSDLVGEAHERIKHDALAAQGNPSPQRGEAGRGVIWQPSPIPPSLLTFARDLRKNMTDAEQLLWQCLRGKQLDGFKFRKQHPLDRFVLDFYCVSCKIAIELDGGQHNIEEGIKRDAERTAYLEKCGIRVLRFWNHEVFKNLDGVLKRIWGALHEGGGAVQDPHPGPHPGPPPLGEGDFSFHQRGETRRGEKDVPLDKGGTGASAYADAVAVYLAFAISKLSDRGSSICGWDSSRDSLRNTFGRQAIPMVWDFAEANFLSDSAGSYNNAVDQGARVLYDSLPAGPNGNSSQADASIQPVSAEKVVSTDPPYYDNIGYADLSDFFYVWLRRSLKTVYPDLFSTLAVPKAEELVATPYRHGSKAKAESFFLTGMTEAMRRLAEQAHPGFPVTIYYAFKQSENDGADGISSTGWDTFLDAVIRAGFAVTGTWPIRTEMKTRQIAMGTNSLASSIVLVCRARTPLSTLPNAPRWGKEKAPSPSGGGPGWGFGWESTWGQTATRREFVTALKAELPVALTHLQRGNIAPVDLAQAAIGPGMAVYTRYSKVLDAEGKPLSVRDALVLINQTLDEALAEQEGDFDADSRWALAWFEQVGFNDGAYGEAETLSKAKNTSVSGMVEAGILSSSRGKVRLLWPNELSATWDPATDKRLTAWEVVHQLIRALETGGESAAAALVARLGENAEIARELAYRLYTLCERKKRTAEALSYNGLVQSWPEISRLARSTIKLQPQTQNAIPGQE